jgi:transposase
MVHLTRKILKGNPYLYLEETGRVNGKPRRIWSKYLGPENKIKDLASLEFSIDTSEIEPLDFGLPMALMQLVEKLDLVRIINNATFKRKQGLSVGEYMVISALNRCVKPVSKRKIRKWFDSTALDALFPNHETYLDSMAYTNHYDYLTDRAFEKIEKEITQKLNQNFQVDMSQLMYDPTNFYTYCQSDEEDEESMLAQFGHGKEGRTNLRIIGLNLVCTQDGGVPLFFNTYPGDVPDSALFKEQVKTIKDRIDGLNLGKDIEIVLTFDKGNNSEKAFAELDKSRVFFLASIRPSMVKDLAEIPAQNFFHTTLPRGKDVGVIEFKREFYGKPRRLIMVYNRDLALRQGAVLLGRLEEKCEEVLEFFQDRLNIKKWRSLPAIQKKLEELIPASIRNLFHITLIEGIEHHSLNVEINYPALMQKQSLMGKTYLITNHPTKTALELVGLFRQQITVERAFRFLKSPEILHVRPIYSRKDTSIKGHIFTCVLGLLLLTLLTRVIQKFRPQLTLEEVVDLLSSVKVAEIEIPGRKRDVRKLCKMTPEAQDLVELLGLTKYL